MNKTQYIFSIRVPEYVYPDQRNALTGTIAYQGLTFNIDATSDEDALTQATKQYEDTRKKALEFLKPKDFYRTNHLSACLTKVLKKW